MLGSDGYIGYGVESQEGTTVAPTKFLILTSIDFPDTNEYIIPDEISGSRFRGTRMSSAYNTSGTAEGNFYPNNVAELLKSVFAAGSGNTTSSPYSGGAYQHVFIPGKVSPTLSFEVGVDDPLLVRRFGGIRVNTLEVNAAFNEIVNCSYGLEGTTREIIQSVTSPHVSANRVDPFHFTGAGVYRNGSPVGTVKSLTLSFGNNIERIGTLQKTRNWRRTALGLYDVSASGTIDFDGIDEYQLFLDEEEFELRVNFEGPEISPGVRYTFDIVFPRTSYNTIGTPFSAGQIVEQSFEAAILEPQDGVTPIFTATLVNVEETVLGG